VDGFASASAFADLAWMVVAGFSTSRWANAPATFHGAAPYFQDCGEQNITNDCWQWENSLTRQAS